MLFWALLVEKKNIVEEDDNEIQECDEADDNNSIEDEDENSD